MNRVWLAVLASVFSAPAFAQTGVLYNPTRTIKDQGITVHAWGSGTVAETEEAAYAGTHSIRVFTRNLFQGGAINLSSPMDMSRTFEDRNNLLRLVFRSVDAGGTSGTRRGGGMMGGGGFPGGGMMGGGGFPGGGMVGGGAGAGGGLRGGAAGGGQRGGGGFPGGGMMGGGVAGGGQFGGGTSNTENTLKTLRFIVTTSDGKKSEAYVPVSTTEADTRGWKSVSVPLQSIAGFDRTNKMISGLTVTGDGSSMFFIGDVRVVNDSTPIHCEPNKREMNLALNDQVLFYATGSGGTTILKYTWDFDKSDGIQVDAEGQAVYRKFRKPGTYTVTVTASDYYGLKPSYSTDIKVVVNP